MTSLGTYLKGEGFKVNDLGVPLGRETTWSGVKWIFVHHTGSTDDPKNAPNDAKYIKTATGRFPPLSQLMLGRDQTIYVTTRQRPGNKEPGRASHAGQGIYPGIPRDSGNQVSLGIEVQCAGVHPLSTHKDSYALLIRLCASLCRRYGLDHSKVIGHKEYSSQGKIDPRDSMTKIRADVKAALNPPKPVPPKPGIEEGEMKNTISLTDLDQPLVLAEDAIGFVDFRDVDEDDENFFGDVSIIPTRYIDFDCSGWLMVSGPCRVRVCRYSEDGTTYGAAYTVFDWPAAGYLPFSAQGGCPAKNRLRIRIDAAFGPVTVSDGRWITRYRDHLT